jgi:hypothetical protein
LIKLQLSQYRIDAEIGRGGMGVVYRAHDTELDRTVALKVLPAAAVSGVEERARFYREAKAAAGLSHPNIATVYGIGEAVPEGAPHGTEPQPFIAMEFVDGESLSPRIARGPVPLREAVRIARDMADALGEAHGSGIVHRDVKSSNVMLTSKDRVKVLDFGLAKTAASTLLTREGATLGTAVCMSPEQTQGLEVDHRTDIWALGVVLYEMVSGRLPFSGDYEQAVVYAILNTEPEPLTSLRTGVPMELERIVTKCLAKDVGRRYAGMADLRVDLDALLESGLGGSSASGQSAISTMSGVSRPGVYVEQAAKPTPRRSKALIGGLATLAVFAAVGVGWVLGQSGGSDPPTASIAPSFTFSVDVPAPGGIARRPSASPDGQLVAYLADGEFFLHHGDGRTVRGPALPGPVEFLAAARDSRSFAVAAGTEQLGFAIYKVSVDADSLSAPMKMADVPEVVGMVFGPDDNLYIGGRKGLYRLEPGQDRPDLFLDADQFDGRFVLYPNLMADQTALAVVLAPGPEVGWLSVEGLQGAVVELLTGRTTVLAQVAVTLLPSGYLVYLEGQYRWTLRRFDMDTQEFSGERVVLDYQFSPASAGITSSGIMTSFPGDRTREYEITESTLRPSETKSWFSDLGGMMSTRLNPDLTRYATMAFVDEPEIHIGRNGQRPVRLSGLPKKIGLPSSMVWSASGTALYVTSSPLLQGGNAMFRLDMDGAASFVELASYPNQLTLLKVLPDGRSMLGVVPDSATAGSQLVRLDLETNALTEMAKLPAEHGLLAITAGFSPDGRFITYPVRDATNVVTLRVQETESSESRLLVEGYISMSWIDDSTVLLEREAAPAADPPRPARYYRQSISASAVLQGQPTLIAEVPDAEPGQAVYNPATGGVVVPTAIPQDTVPLTIHTNWFAELDRLVSTGQ